MPRASTARRNNATASSSRHEAGLIQPSKRLPRQRSNGQLNGALKANGNVALKLTQNTTSERSAQAASSTQHGLSEQDGASRRCSLVGDHDEVFFANGVTRSSSSTSAASFDAANSSPATDHSQSNDEHVYFNKNGTTDTFGTPSFPGLHAFTMVSTILNSYPLGDTIAILILLLQIPQAFLLIIHGVFTALTFATPTGPLGFLPRMNDFVNSSIGEPALGTALFCDALGVVLWTFLWTPLQHLVLDFTQVVIAVSLGGSSTNDGGGTRAAGFCISILTLSHLLMPQKSKSLRNEADFTQSTAPAPYAIATIQSYCDIVGTYLALHISTQGIVRWVRKYLRQYALSSKAKATQKSDPGAKSKSGANTPPTNGTVHLTPVSNLPGPTDFVAKETDPKPLTAKKQATLVRTHQPLWAAIASARVFRIKQAAESIFGSHIASFSISQVGSNDFSFSADFDLPGSKNENDSEEGDGYISTGVDKSRPFYLKINSTDWASTRLCKRLGSDSTAAQGIFSEWAGEVHGLAPLTTYQVEFVRSSDDLIMYRTDVMTESAASAAGDEGPVAPSPTGLMPTTLRPSSPTTTLKNSVASAEARLGEEKARQKRTRKDHSKHLTTLRAENDKLNQRLSNSGTGDEKLRGKFIQIKQSTRQAEESITLAKSRIESLGPVPKELFDRWTAKKAEWETEKEAQEKAESDLDQAKQDLSNQLSAVQAEAAAARRNRERQQTRLAKIQEQHDRLSILCAQDNADRQRKDAEATAKEAQRVRDEKTMTDLIASREQTVRDLQGRTSNLWLQSRNLEQIMQQHIIQAQQQQAQQAAVAAQQQHADFNGLANGLSPLPVAPLTPEGDLPGTGKMRTSEPYRPFSAQTTYPFPPFSQMSSQPMVPSASAMMGAPGPSSSGSSTVLGGNIANRLSQHHQQQLTGGNLMMDDEDDEDPAPPAPSARGFWSAGGLGGGNTSSSPSGVTAPPGFIGSGASSKRVSPVPGESSTAWQRPN